MAARKPRLRSFLQIRCTESHSHAGGKWQLSTPHLLSTPTIRAARQNFRRWPHTQLCGHRPLTVADEFGFTLRGGPLRCWLSCRACLSGKHTDNQFHVFYRCAWSISRLCRFHRPTRFSPEPATHLYGRGASIRMHLPYFSRVRAVQQWAQGCRAPCLRLSVPSTEISPAIRKDLGLCSPPFTTRNERRTAEHGVLSVATGLPASSVRVILFASEPTAALPPCA